MCQINFMICFYLFATVFKKCDLVMNLFLGEEFHMPRMVDVQSTVDAKKPVLNVLGAYQEDLKLI